MKQASRFVGRSARTLTWSIGPFLLALPMAAVGQDIVMNDIPAAYSQDIINKARCPPAFGEVTTTAGLVKGVIRISLSYTARGGRKVLIRRNIRELASSDGLVINCGRASLELVVTGVSIDAPNVMTEYSLIVRNRVVTSTQSRRFVQNPAP